ncbi:hypothetical protein LAZ67_20000775 [Cordylochernes scorpioides]|uniref:Reverse transcriptase domain-containing protein n=1 Tax=Cordylochernes scorpioides TaxID=51811 RepID=A0ABY6LJF9_9ARAC|nr:hypothetical protein LAZ67_20000775 [Cordylochernes scorpioides]
MPGHRKRRQFKQTDAFTRGMVIGLKRAGWSIRQIAADTHLGACTVHRLWRRWLEQGNVAIYRNVGATRVTSARVDRRILRQAVAAPQATCTAILQHVQDTLDHSISTRTISRRLVANGLHSCRPLRRLSLTPPNRRQRLEWCRARSTWMTEWHRVVFSDESRFCLSSDSRRVRVWRRRGERSNPAAIVERPTVRQRGIMVWGAIAYDSRSPLLRIQGTMTAQRYVDDVLRPVTLPYLQGVPNALYQQDNARPHTARISQQALQDVQMLPWPPYSPDLSPIEHVWDIIGRRLHALPQPRSEDELWQMVEREWRAIPQDAIRTLIDSLPRRVAACIAVRAQPAIRTLRYVHLATLELHLLIIEWTVHRSVMDLSPATSGPLGNFRTAGDPSLKIGIGYFLQVSQEYVDLQENVDYGHPDSSVIDEWDLGLAIVVVEAYLPQSPQGVVNLSDYVLPSADAEILSLGLKYRLPGPSDIPRIIAGVEPALRGLNHQDTHKIRHFVASTLQRPYNIPKPSLAMNRVISRLKRNRDIVITKSDKGSQTVILNTTVYKQKMQNVLDQHSIFSAITEQEHKASVKNFRLLLLRLKRSQQITKEQYNDFTANLAQIAYIYGLPKIHKPDVPLRPIISYHLSPAYTLSKFLSNFLTPLLQSPPWEYTIANSPSFVSYITSLTPPPRSIMVSFDVTSLYLSLAHPLIINSLRTFLENAPLLDTLTAETVVELTSICLGMSTFTFDTQFFKQTKGSPMGSPLSTVVAEVVMRSLDQWITSRHSSDIFLWRRYIDDTFCLVSEVSTSHILSDLNSFHPDIAFTHETENHSVLPFLDTLVIRTPSSFHTTVYYKNNTPPHHTNFRSHCPTPHKINTVRALTKRIFTHCSLPLFQTIEKAKIFSYLSKSGYPIPFILKHMHDPHHNSAPAIHRNICSLPFCPQSITIARFLRQHGITTYFQNPPNIATLIRHPITRSSLHASALRSGGAVYSVSCDQCNATYVGETGRSVAIRMHRRWLSLVPLCRGSCDVQSVLSVHETLLVGYPKRSFPSTRRCLWDTPRRSFRPQDAACVLNRLRFLPIKKKWIKETCIKFCVKNEIKCADAFRMLTVAYGEATLDRSNVYRWYKMFSEGREDVNDEERAGRPSTSTTDEKIMKWRK